VEGEGAAGHPGGKALTWSAGPTPACKYEGRGINFLLILKQRRTCKEMKIYVYIHINGNKKNKR
jgi:hypothetical protein